MQKSVLTFVVVVVLGVVRIALAADDGPLNSPALSTSEPETEVIAEAESLTPRPSAVRETVVIEPTVDSPTSKIRQELGKPTILDFVETPLVEVVQFLQDQHQMQIKLDGKSLEDAGIATDRPVTMNLQGTTLRSALNLLLRGLDLTFVVEDEVLSITTREAAQDRLTVKVYPVDDLIIQSGKGKTPPLTGALIQVITSTVGPDSWESAGGTGSIEPFRGSLVISQNEEVHQAVAQLLRQLRMPAVAVARDAMPVEEPRSYLEERRPVDAESENKQPPVGPRVGGLQ